MLIIDIAIGDGRALTPAQVAVVVFLRLLKM
jgi:hypothetical protein